MGGYLSEIGELVFSLVISYMGALEFLYVVRHLYHWSFRHPNETENDAESLTRLQENLRSQLSEAKAREVLAGNNAMQDGVLYKDGFRIDPDRDEIEKLKSQHRFKEEKELRRKEIEEELAKQKQIEEETRKQLQEAEAKLALERKEYEKQRVEDEKLSQLVQKNEEGIDEESAENDRQLLKAEKKREEEESKLEADRQVAEDAQKFLEEEEEEEERERDRLKEEQAEERKKTEQRRIAENERNLLEAERKEQEQQQKLDKDRHAAKEAQKLLEAERNREKEEEERRIKEAEDSAIAENKQKLLEAERRHQEEERKLEAERNAAADAKQKEEEDKLRKEAEDREAADSQQKILEAERQREEEQRKLETDRQATEIPQTEFYTKENEEQEVKDEKLQNEEVNREAADNVQQLLDAEIQFAEEQRKLDRNLQEVEESETLLIAEKGETPHDQPEEEELRDNGNKLLEAEREFEEEQHELEEGHEVCTDTELGFLGENKLKQRQEIIEENARKFLEVEQEMVELQEKMFKEAEHELLETVESEPQSPVIEEPCIKKIISPYTAADSENERVTQTVKTQFGQTKDEPYSVTTKPILFPGLSDDSSSIDPYSSKQSSFSTQPSEDFTTATEGVTSTVELQFPQQERQEPDGEDNTPSVQYTDDYLRSLDGIKNKPLVREDGSGRRRAFKKRRSSGSSVSSRDSRTSRDEEVKMFTSLEEEELQGMQKGEGDFTPIKYTSEPTLKVKGHHRRHKRSPAKDTKGSEESLRSSLEMLGEENTDPWGEVIPEHYKETEFWKREKALSIDEEGIELEKSVLEAVDAPINVPKSSSFEEATDIQNEEAVSTLQKTQSSDDNEEQNKTVNVKDDAQKETITNLQSSRNTERNASPARSSASPRLRRSPRIDEMDHYEERWVEKTETVSKSQPQSSVSTPTISVEPATDNGPWRDQYGLIMEGLSDFYDFTASVNPSRSRSTSRNPSPANSQPSSPIPKNVSNIINDESLEYSSIDVYDDTAILEECELKRENIIDFIESLEEGHPNMSIEVVSSSELNQTNSSENLQVLNNNLRLIIRNDVEEQNLQLSSEEERSPITIPTLCINDESAFVDKSDENNEGKIQVLRASSDRSRSRSRSSSPLPTQENIERSLKSRRTKLIKHNDELFEKLISGKENTEGVDHVVHTEAPSSSDDEDSRKNVRSLVESLRAERTRSTSRSRSKSPLPTAANVQRSLEARRSKRIQHNDEIFEKLATVQGNSPEIPIISVEGAQVDEHSEAEDIECSKENMARLVESLRVNRSRSRSKTPIRTSEKSSIEDLNQSSEFLEKECGRSRSPSRSLSPENDEPEYNFIERPSTEPNFENFNPDITLVVENRSDFHDFHKMLNLEASDNRTLEKNSEELESLLAVKQRQLDAEALQKLKTANEETELRTLTSSAEASEEDLSKEENDFSHLAVSERLRQLRCSPTTPDYDRTISEEWNDVQRIKEDLLQGGFKRSTYVGESLELGSEFEPLRREAAHFQRSRSPTPSLDESQLTEFKNIAAEKRKLQDVILAELTTASECIKGERSSGTIPKTPVLVEESVESTEEYEDIRREMAEFRRSHSKSRSPLQEGEIQIIEEVEAEAAKRELRDKLLDDIEETSKKYPDFSLHLNVDFLDDRRASDSALIQKPELLLHFQDNDSDLEPEEYHHFRRFSLDLEQPMEEYPNDDYIYVSQIEVHTPKGTRTWIREDYYSNDFKALGMNLPDPDNVEELLSEGDRPVRDEDESDGSEDERQTVVEVEDEIDEDINDFNERGPADESHHEQSECEEAEREVDHYAGREANDWKEIENASELPDGNIEGANSVEGAVGGATYDSDSFAIDQIYNEAIKNRKQSGILRDFDSILMEIQDNYINNIGPDGNKVKANDATDNDRYALWAKSRELERSRSNSQRSNGIESTIGLLESERRDYELRYLGDANVSARQSTRLRSRYGYVPVLQSNTSEVIDVDVNYKPKREYNWRKNFKIDEDDSRDFDNELNNSAQYTSGDDESSHQQFLDIRKYSLGGESITLFSRSPDRDIIGQTTLEDRYTEDVSKDVEFEEVIQENFEQEIFNESQEIFDKPKKKKSKKKSRKGSKSNIEDFMKYEDDLENQVESRRGSMVQFEAGSPKRKSYSRRSSRASITIAEEPTTPFSPITSIGFDYQPIADVIGENETEPTKKKTKKRKKTKELKSVNSGSFEETSGAGYLDEPVPYRPIPVSGNISPESASANILSALSPQLNSVCATPVPTDSEENGTNKISPSLTTFTKSAKISTEATSIKANETTEVAAPVGAPATVPETTKTTTTTTGTTIGVGSSRTPIDSFDILKDANFYPLF